MKRIIRSAVAVALAIGASLAQSQTFTGPPQAAVVVFSNDVLVSPEGARRALDRLQDEIGNTSGQTTMGYALAYNSRIGAGDAIAQSAAANLATFDSRVMFWLTRHGLIPTWFDLAIQAQLTTAAAVAPSDVADQSAAISAALLNGQKMLLVPHGLGDAYSDAALQTVSTQVDAARFSSIGVFSVSPTESGIGLSVGPYYTHQLDFVPGSIAGSPVFNWTLHNAADGSVAAIASAITAHDFNAAYLSLDYDLRAAIATALQAQIAKLPSPVLPAGGDYRPDFVGLLAGSFPARCTDESASSVSVTTAGQLVFPDGVFDSTGPLTTVSLDRTIVQLSTTGVPEVSLLSNRADGTAAGGSWTMAGGMEQFGSRTQSCKPPQQTPAGSFNQPVDFAAKVVEEMGNYRGGFPTGRCSTVNLSTGASNSLAGWQPVLKTGTLLQVGPLAIDLAAARDDEIVSLQSAESSSPADYEPQFAYVRSVGGNVQLSMTFKRYTGLRTISYSDGAVQTSCTLD